VRTESTSVTDTAIENLVIQGFDLDNAPVDATHYDTKLKSWIKIKATPSGNEYYWYNQHGWQPFANCDHDQERLVEIKRPDKIIQKPTVKKPSMAEMYPKYYKDFTGVDEADVYLVHDRFQIDDPSGCIHHASKKLLLCGVRTGGKDMATEIKEARDTLTRKLQLMGVE